MSDVQDFLNEMGVHNYDRNDAVPIKAEELQDGEYIVKIKSARPRRVDSLNCWCFDWVYQIEAGPNGKNDPSVGQNVSYGNLLGTDAAKNRLGVELERIGFTGKDFTAILNNAIASLPNRHARIKKMTNSARNGKVYHNIYIQELIDSKIVNEAIEGEISDNNDGMPF